MRRQNKILLPAVIAIVAVCSCNQAPEQPVVNQGYDNSFVMPEAEILSAEDRAVISAMEDEYDENVNK